MISVTPIYKDMLEYLYNKLGNSIWADFILFLDAHSDDELHDFDKFSMISDTLESFCDENDLPEGFWMNYGSEIDIIKDMFTFLLIRLCVEFQKS